MMWLLTWQKVEEKKKMNHQNTKDDKQFLT